MGARVIRLLFRGLEQQWLLTQMLGFFPDLRYSLRRVRARGEGGERYPATNAAPGTRGEGRVNGERRRGAEKYVREILGAVGIYSLNPS